jgi:hypothetical protein
MNERVENLKFTATITGGLQLTTATTTLCFHDPIGITFLISAFQLGSKQHMSPAPPIHSQLLDGRALGYGFDNRTRSQFMTYGARAHGSTNDIFAMACLADYKQLCNSFTSIMQDVQLWNNQPSTPSTGGWEHIVFVRPDVYVQGALHA